ncbi:hypothetical protein PILCRDRAFT_812533 [Piloderma croceum F 1598]|uniref:Calcium channel YVC1-like C-terminal transmembrane domain-containing protein n=1 Tax=Piloderma croceum (strain F 1598) TaxID=765440 RepID=A0A0C3BT77_PILCF|nr:hypothetical protein PILCRDRAFT_812533 [Piloderma croceum F 1598]
MGSIVYAATSFFDILPDHYKRKQIALYNPREAPILDHYRLKVPRVRQALETIYFLVLFASFFVVLQQRRNLSSDAPVSKAEIWLILYGLGLTLDKIASILEHGWTVFTANMWNGLDFCFCCSFIVYFSLVVSGKGEEGHAILACGAVLLFPRLAFVTLSNNVLVLALRAMMADFFFLMVLAVWCFLGFLYALWILGHGQYSVYDISKWMIWIWFGLDSTGLELARNFHAFWGPVLFVTYACLSTTLLLTVLVSILATRFADINRDAIEEYMFRRAVVVFEGIKSDAIFNYWPPVNLLALTVLVPIRFILTPRRFHSLNVFCTRVSAAPILILIAFYERRIFGSIKATSSIGANHELKVARGMSRFEVRADVEALIDYFARDNRGADPESRTARPRHLSVTSMMEHGLSHQQEVNENSSNVEWQTELKQRLEGIENALLMMSKHGRRPAD